MASDEPCQWAYPDGWPDPSCLRCGLPIAEHDTTQEIPNNGGHYGRSGLGPAHNVKSVLVIGDINGPLVEIDPRDYPAFAYIHPEAPPIDPPSPESLALSPCETPEESREVADLYVKIAALEKENATLRRKLTLMGEQLQRAKNFKRSK